VSKLSRAVLPFLFCLALAAFAYEITVIKSAPVYIKSNGKIVKLGTASAGKKLQAIGKIDGGKYYRIQLKNREAYISARAVSADKKLSNSGESSSEESSSSKALGNTYAELGFVGTLFPSGNGMQIAPELGFYFPISVNDDFAVEPGIFADYYLFNSDITTLFVGGVLRFSFRLAPIIVSPEADFVWGYASSGGVSAYSINYGGGLFLAYPFGNHFQIAAGMRMYFRGGASGNGNLNARIVF
jgi:hypothetical protein